MSLFAQKGHTNVYVKFKKTVDSIYSQITCLVDKCKGQYNKYIIRKVLKINAKLEVI